MAFTSFWGKCASFFVFLLLDLLDIVFCVMFRIKDKFREGQGCGCYSNEGRGLNLVGNGDGEISETLFGRKNVFREMGFHSLAEKVLHLEEESGVGECGCGNCVPWIKDADQKLHVVVKEPSHETTERGKEKSVDNVIFLHGFLSSSSYWTKNVFPNLSESTNRNNRLFVLDLLGFGRSPMPINCMYTLKDHLEMIEKSVIRPFQLDSFHLVAHSMGCIVALALAAKHSKYVKSITLVAPPYFPSSECGASLRALNTIAEKKVWPTSSFVVAVFSWYEHLNRFACFLVLGKHQEWISKLRNGKRRLHAVESTRHLHHSCWHNMHNVICGGAKLMDQYLEVLRNAGVRIRVIHGDRDNVIPVECSKNLKMKIEDAKVDIIPNADHHTIITRRRKEFIQDLEHTWSLSHDINT